MRSVSAPSAWPIDVDLYDEGGPAPVTVLVVDTSAVVALLKSEPGWEALASRLHAAPSRLLSVAGWVELSLVVAGRHGDAATLAFLDRFLKRQPLNDVQSTSRRPGRPRGVSPRKGRHPAGLNFGDRSPTPLVRSDPGRALLFVATISPGRTYGLALVVRE